MENKVPAGMRKSGKFWKSTKTRFSSALVSRPHAPLRKKLRLKEEMASAKAAEAARLEERRLRLEQLKERRHKNKERKEANARKAEVVQVIRDTRKIKKMKKSQLRYIEKRDISQLKVA